MSKQYSNEEKTKFAEERKQRVQELTLKLETGITEMFENGTYENYLKTMNSFRKYSFNNSMLIHIQFPNATYVSSYTNWKKLGRTVKKGEKGIQIFAPAVFKYKEKVKKQDDNGNEIEIEKEQKGTYFTTTTVFDISQTEGEDIDIAKELSEDIEDCDTLIDAIIKVSSANFDFSTSFPDKKSFTENGITYISNNVCEIEAIRAMLVEEVKNIIKTNQEPMNLIIVPESVAYVICQHYGIDTSNYSFGEIAKHAQSVEMKELKKNLNFIANKANEMIKKIDEIL